jgi:hypothetical protein
VRDTGTPPGAVANSPAATETRVRDTGTPPGGGAKSPAATETRVRDTGTPPGGVAKWPAATETRVRDAGVPPGGSSTLPAATEASAREAVASSTRGVARSGERGRYVPVTVRRGAHARDGGRCAFVSADGRRCEATALLEFDHVRPYARSGATDAANIRLLCRAHNLLHARHCFGAMHLAAKIAAGKRADSARGRAAG